MTDKKKNLFYLDELSDYKVASDDPDVRGWKVKDVDNRVVGTVDNLLVSKAKEKVVYLDVEVDESIIEADHKPYGKPASGDVHEFINKDGENHLIVPVGLTRLNTDEKYVYTDRINHKTFAETKRMEKGREIDRDYEMVVLETYNRDTPKTGTDTTTGRTETGTTTGRTGTDATTGRQETGTGDTAMRTGGDEGLGSTRTETDRDRTTGTGSSENRRTGGPSDAAGKDARSEDRGTYDQRRQEGNIPDDDSFYERKEFDRKNYRNNR